MKTKIFYIMLLIGCTLNINTYATNNSINQNVLDELVKMNNIPGLNFSIINKNGQQFNYSSGFADTTNMVKLNENHVLFSGSVGKTYAVAVLMQLVDEGKVELGKPFMSYFPNHEWLFNIPNIEDITVEMLLNHTSGLPRYINDEEVWKTLKANPDKVWTYKDRLSYTFNMEPVHEPGKSWSYSDTNYLLIGMLIEKITGSDYYDEVTKRILKPGMLNNTYPSLKRDIPNLAVGYSALGEPFNMSGAMVKDGIYAFNPQMEWTGGGFSSTTPDLARWAKMYFEGKFFSEKMLQKITTPSEQGTEIAEGFSCGMGCFIYNTENGIAYGHTGLFPGYNTIFAYFPEQKIAIALQVNCDYARKDMDLIEYVLYILNNMSI